MDIVIFLVFVSLTLVAGALVFFVSRLQSGDFDHAARLSLLPLQDDDGASLESAPPTPHEDGAIDATS